MKKTCLFLATLFLLMSCGNTQDEPTNGGKRNIRESELYVYSGSSHAPLRAGAIPGVDVPVDDQYIAYFYIRIDGNIPGEDVTGLHSEEYFPRTKTNKSVLSDLNKGYINANVEWKTNFKFSHYVYSTDGSAVQSIIVKEPTLDDLVAANQGIGDDLSGYLANKDKLHFIWYICKKQDGDKAWHIDGVLTSLDRTDVSETIYADDILGRYPEETFTKDEGDVNRQGHVEVDIHQQQHTDWNEIKTSIHLRDTVAVDVYLPLEYELLADDFAIRAGVDYEYVTEIANAEMTIDGTTYALSAEITHAADGIHIHIEPNLEALRAARLRYDDGITYEIHNYVSNLVDEESVWLMLKNATYSVDPYTKLVGQVTSAMFE